MAKKTQTKKQGKPKGSWGGPRPNSGRKPGLPDIAPLADRQHIAELARQHAHTAIQTLLEICLNGESEAARVTAAVNILDRGFGKPPQQVELANKDGEPFKIQQAFDSFLGVLNNIAQQKADKPVAH